MPGIAVSQTKIRLIFYFSLFIALIASFIGGYFSNIAAFQQVARLVNSDYASSGLNTIGIYFEFSDETYDYKSIQSNVTSTINSGWPNNTFNVLPFYNVDDDIKIRVDDYDEPLYLIPNSNWETHISTSGTGNTLGSYDLSLVNLYSINDKGEHDNFCFIPESMSLRLNKNIGDFIEIKFEDMVFSYVIRNLISNGVSTASGIEDTYGDNYIIANQSDINPNIKKHLCICRYFTNSKASFATIYKLKQLATSNGLFKYQHLYEKTNREKIQFNHENEIIESLNNNDTATLFITIPLLVLSTIFLVISIIFSKKIFELFLSKIDIIIVSSIFITVPMIFAFIAILTKNIRFFSIVSTIVFLIIFALHLFLTIKTKIAKKQIETEPSQS